VTTPPEAATPAELTTAVGRAFELIAVLRGQIDAILDELQARKSAEEVTVIRWADLDPDTASRTWPQLYHWVTWLLDRYTIREIPRSCWWQHGLIVEELTALWIAWQGAYGPDTTTTAALFWHEHLDRTRDRIRTRLVQQGNCAAGGHQPPTPQPHPDQIRHDFDGFVQADTAARATANSERQQPLPDPALPPPAT
jgi:hypothetical protein